MSGEFFEWIPPLLPIAFFSISSDVGYARAAPSSRALRKSFLLPDTSALLQETRFADVAICWNEEGIEVEAFVDKKFEGSVFPRFSEGDALEIFIDTRDVKSAGFATRFCHHFVVLPKPVQNISAQELTHFRTEDTHPLCASDELVVKTQFHRSAFQTRITIPAHCLCGYDPQICDRIGFTYKIHRAGGAPQHFSISSDYFSIEQTPRLWATLNLRKAI